MRLAQQHPRDGLAVVRQCVCSGFQAFVPVLLGGIRSVFLPVCAHQFLSDLCGELVRIVCYCPGLPDCAVGL